VQEEFRNDTFFNNITTNLDALSFIHNMRKVDVCLWEFIQHAYEGMARRDLVARS
jgi:uncharacterized protein YlbG (UPF0298 family)